jgi:hypothetical protein
VYLNLNYALRLHVNLASDYDVMALLLKRSSFHPLCSARLFQNTQAKIESMTY